MTEIRNCFFDGFRTTKPGGANFHFRFRFVAFFLAADSRSRKRCRQRIPRRLAAAGGEFENCEMNEASLLTAVLGLGWF